MMDASTEQQLTSDMVAAVEFDSVRRGGYNSDQVDAFVTMARDALTAWESAPAQVIEVLVQQSAEDVVAVRPTGPDVTTATATVASMLSDASATVLHTLAEAEEQAAAIVAEADETGERIVIQAQRTADAILDDAEIRKAELEQQITQLTEARDRLARTLTDAARGANALVDSFATTRQTALGELEAAPVPKSDTSS